MAAFPGIDGVEDIEDIDDDEDDAADVMSAPGSKKNGGISENTGQMSQECKKCGQVLLPSAKFCTECGAKTSVGGAKKDDSDAAASTPGPTITVEVASEPVAEMPKPGPDAIKGKGTRTAPENVVDKVSEVSATAQAMRHCAHTEFFFHYNIRIFSFSSEADLSFTHSCSPAATLDLSSSNLVHRALTLTAPSLPLLLLLLLLPPSVFCFN